MATRNVAESCEERKQRIGAGGRGAAVDGVGSGEVCGGGAGVVGRVELDSIRRPIWSEAFQLEAGDAVSLPAAPSFDALFVA